MRRFSAASRMQPRPSTVDRRHRRGVDLRLPASPGGFRQLAPRHTGLSDVADGRIGQPDCRGSQWWQPDPRLGCWSLCHLRLWPARGAILMVRGYEARERRGEAFGDEMIVDETARLAVPSISSAIAIAVVFVPLAVAGSRAGLEVAGPMAVAVLGGLVTTVVVNVVVLPRGVLAMGLCRCVGPDGRRPVHRQRRIIFSRRHQRRRRSRATAPHASRYRPQRRTRGLDVVKPAKLLIVAAGIVLGATLVAGCDSDAGDGRPRRTHHRRGDCRFRHLAPHAERVGGAALGYPNRRCRSRRRPDGGAERRRHHRSRGDLLGVHQPRAVGLPAAGDPARCRGRTTGILRGWPTARDRRW